MMINSNVNLMNNRQTYTNVKVQLKNSNSNKVNNKNVNMQNKAFDKEIENLRKHIENINKDKNMDIGKKNKLIKDLQNQIEEIEQLKRMSEKENLKSALKQPDDIKKHKDTNITKNEDGDTLELNQAFDDMMKLDNTLKQSKKIKSIQVNMQGESRILKSEIKIDKSRGVDTSAKENRLSKVEENIQKLKKDMGKNNKKINDEILSSSKEENDKLKIEKEELHKIDKKKYNKVLQYQNIDIKY
ncbi:MAG: hypothetical protein N4A48_09010 [Tepidibacter sp.]|jgi:hypothetical protein|uniref:hypothetical protein n=1 Tax=Tepidibacter sp. TaxID=2529387 RepID=UPI0025D3A5DD|nr:hypothetical protein [Tepidibacter sp.]MCT4508885.1 hypothetical protein [Tepidibacter sp.]